jgi:hypothetical protein
VTDVHHMNMKKQDCMVLGRYGDPSSTLWESGGRPAMTVKRNTCKGFKNNWLSSDPIRFLISLSPLQIPWLHIPYVLHSRQLWLNFLALYTYYILKSISSFVYLTATAHNLLAPPPKKKKL